MEKILVTVPSMPKYEEYIEEIKDIWETKHITNFGPKYCKFISMLKDKYNYRNIDIQCNGHMVLQNMLSCVEPGEVITTPFTFVSTVLAIYNAGHVPVFCDINIDDYNIDVSKIENLVTEKTVAIVPVHVFGSPCNVEEIQRIADKYNLKVIYDAAHAFNVRVGEVEIGNFGDASMFSLHATKVFNSVEGGLGVFRTSAMLEECKSRSNFGLVNGETVYDGVNSKFNEFQAAMGIVNLAHVEEDIEKRRKIVEAYDKSFEEITEIQLLERKEGIVYNYAYYPIVLKENCGKSVVQLMEYLKERDIFARRYFYPAVNEMPLFAGSNKTEIAHQVSENVVCLPLYASLEMADIDKICSVIKEFFGYE